MLQRYAAILRVMIITAVTCVGYGWLVWKGPMPVYRGAEQLPGAVPQWYMLSAFPVLGMLLADLGGLWLKQQKLAFVELSAQVVVLVAVSSVRLDSHLPISGHMLLLTYFLLRRLLIPMPARSLRLPECAVGGLLVLATSYMKFLVWDDVTTWGTGLIGGAILACLSWLLWRYARKQKLRDE